MIQRLRRLGLRARVTLAFALGGLILSALLAGTTWGFARENLIRQRESTVIDRTVQNAAIVKAALVGGEQPGTVVNSLRSPTAAESVLVFDQRPFVAGGVSGDVFSNIPAEMRATINGGQPSRMRIDAGGATQLIVGIPLPAANASYYEIISLSDLDETLDSLAVSLLAAALVTTIAGGLLGWYAGRRIVRPLAGVGEAAEAIASGRLETRLDVRHLDPDLQRLGHSFNDMAQSLQDRIEADMRFASDVSHELRSPLMTLQASLQVLESRKDELSERARQAFDLLYEDVQRFQKLVEDLLEISRADAQSLSLDLDIVHLGELVRYAVRGSIHGRSVTVDVEPSAAAVLVKADKRRLERAISNLLDNAHKYGGGATDVLVRRGEESAQVIVEDNGPGVPELDRELIFERFNRGEESRRRGSGEGVGLGLSLVFEHMRLHGGSVWVEDRPDGETGARFVLELPVADTLDDDELLDIPNTEEQPA